MIRWIAWILIVFWDHRYSGIASSVSIDGLRDLWFVAISAVFVILISYSTTTVLSYIPYFRPDDPLDFEVLRISSSFPNIVALPILLLPALCDYSVVYDGFADEMWPEAVSDENRRDACKDTMDGMVFTYFFAWNTLFWSVGYNRLMVAGGKRNCCADNATGNNLDSKDDKKDNRDNDNGERIPRHESSSNSSSACIDDCLESNSKNLDGNVRLNETMIDIHSAACHDINSQAIYEKEEESSHNNATNVSCFQSCFVTVRQMVMSPGFLAMVLGFLTSCVTPLRKALFDEGNVLYPVGSSLVALGQAGTIFANIIVAASLAAENSVEKGSTGVEDPTERGGKDAFTTTDSSLPLEQSSDDDSGSCDSELVLKDSTIGDCNVKNETDRNKSFMRRLDMKNRIRGNSSIIRNSSILLDRIRRSPQLPMHLWYIMSRLVVAPFLVCVTLVVMDCGNMLTNVPSAAKLVVMVNASVPGALVVVVVLKSKGFTDTASILAQVYLPSYLISIFTIAGWTTVGLLISIPRDDGKSFCGS